MSNTSGTLPPLNKRPLPNYDVVPLRSEEIVVVAVQTRLKNVDPENPRPGIKKNLDYLLDCIDVAAGWPVGAPSRAPAVGGNDLLCFTEFCIQGWDNAWTREDWLRIAIELPGEETEIIGKKARQHNCYIALSCHTKEKDWPNHYFNTSIIIGPSGEVIHNPWKAHSLPGQLEYATTVHDVLDEFVERYGWDAVWPVARTDIGNIATFVCSEGFQQETARAFAFKGAEILVRCGGAAVHWTHRGPIGFPIGNAFLGMQFYCLSNNVYGIYVSHALIEDGLLPGSLAGDSAIFDDMGRILKQALTAHSTTVEERIPIASFRKRHSIPQIRKELYDRVYTEYVGKYPPNMYSEHLPKNSADGIRHAREKARW